MPNYRKQLTKERLWILDVLYLNLKNSIASSHSLTFCCLKLNAWRIWDVHEQVRHIYPPYIVSSNSITMKIL